MGIKEDMLGAADAMDVAIGAMGAAADAVDVRWGLWRRALWTLLGGRYGGGQLDGRKTLMTRPWSERDHSSGSGHRPEGWRGIGLIGIRPSA